MLWLRLLKLNWTAEVVVLLRNMKLKRMLENREPSNVTSVEVTEFKIDNNWKKEK